MMRFTAFVTFPLMLGLALVAREFIVLAITEKWIESAKLLQYLCISWASVPLSYLLSNVIISKGKSGVYMGCTVTLAALQIALMWVLYRYGIQTMVVGFVALTCLWVFVWHHFTQRLTGYSLVMFLKDTVPFAFIALCVMVATHYLTSSIENLWILLVVRIVMAAALYFVVLKLAHAKILEESFQFVRKRF